MAVAAPTIPLTQRSALALAQGISSGETTSREVVEAHIELLQRVQPRTGALAMDRFELARAEAEAADVAGPDPTAPLRGVPCTIKESIELEGMPNCAGVLGRRELRSSADAPTVARLRAAGAIPLGVTNTSQLCLWVESANPVYGRTRNPYDPARTAGGSSGGEGAAVGSGGTPFGLGSDVGGSIRLPAFFNGVFGHKPSPGLVPNTGMYPPGEGEVGRLLATGPLARRAEDLMPVLRVLAGPDAGDPLSREATLGDPAEVSLDGLPVLLLERTSFVAVRPEMREARDRAADALAAAGASLQRTSLKSMRRAMELYLATLSSTSQITTAELLADERGPLTLRRAIASRRDYTVATLLLLATEPLASRQPERRIHRAVEAGRALGREVEAILGDGVILHPTHPRAAPKHGRTVGRPWVLGPAAVFNLLGLPVTQVPLGLNRHGLPLGTQVVAARDNDHVAIACALELERAFGGWVPPPPLT